MTKKKKKDKLETADGFTSVGGVLKQYKSEDDKQSLTLRDKQSLPFRDRQSLPLRDKQSLRPYGLKQSLPIEFSRDKYITYEFQKYGYELAKELGDLKNKSLYIKLAKETSRAFLEGARNFVKDASNVKSSAKLFMWKLSELKKQTKLKHKKSRTK